MTEKVNLPSIQDLYGDIEKFSEDSQLNTLLNQPPNNNWLKKHPMAKNILYMPINRVEYLLTRIFINWHVEVLKVQLIANSVCVTVRLFYDWPLGGQRFQDGVGASPLQTDKGSGASDWNAVKNDAVMKALPAAKSYAIKDAAECIGKLFGKDMNRADTIGYDNISPALEREKLARKLSDLVSNIQDIELKDQYISEVLSAERNSLDTIEFYNQKISELEKC